jgi:hypothetical protein
MPGDPAHAPTLLIHPHAYWPRITLPTFIANGRYDFTRRVEPGQLDLIDVIGTPKSEKRAVVYESAHWPFPPRLMSEDVSDWLDDHLGRTMR